MKINRPTLFAASILWIGSLIGAYQLGHREDNASPSLAAADGASAGNGNQRSTSGVRGATGAGDHGKQRDDHGTPSVKQLFVQLKNALRPGAMQNPMSMMRAMAMLDRLRPEDVPEALLEAEAMKDTQMKMMVYMAVLGKWAEQDAPAAMKYAEEHAKDLGMAGGVLKMSVVSAWAESDPEAVWSWYKDNKDEDSGGMFGGNQMVLSSIFANLMTNDPDAAFERLDGLEKSERTMALSGMLQTAMFDDSKREQLLKRIDKMPDPNERSEARQMLVSQWVMFAPDEAAAWVAKQPAEEQKAMRSQVGMMFMMNDPRKGAGFIMEGATDEEKPERYANVVSQWAAQSPDAAAKWLAEQGDGPQLDQARLSLSHSLAEKDPCAAMEQVRAITDPAQRSTAATLVYQKWKSKDADAANAGLESAGLTAEQIESIRSASMPISHE